MRPRRTTSSIASSMRSRLSITSSKGRIRFLLSAWRNSATLLPEKSCRRFVVFFAAFLRVVPVDFLALVDFLAPVDFFALDGRFRADPDPLVDDICVFSFSFAGHYPTKPAT